MQRLRCLTIEHETHRSKRANASDAASLPRLLHPLDRLAHRVVLRGGVRRHGLALLAGVVEIMGGAGIEGEVEPGAGGDRALGDVLTDRWRDFLVVAADKHRDRRGRLHHGLQQRGLAGGFLLAFHLPLRAANEPSQPPDVTDGQFAPNAFIRIDPAGKTTLIMPQVELGQGIYTAVAMILAEELDADFSSVSVLHAPANEKLYANPAFGVQATGGSTSVRAFWKPLREAGASARVMLVQAAARQWQVDPASCTTSNGEVAHQGSGRKLSYGTLVLAASGERPPKDVALKDPKDFALIGKPLKRLDTPDKVNGKVVYGIDAMLPGMKFATLAQSPVFGGKVGKVDDSATRNVPGVRQIVILDDLVAVIGDHTWAAKKGLDALVIDWDEGPHARLSSKDIWQDLRAASEKNGAIAKSTGDIAKGLSSGDKFEESY